MLDQKTPTLSFAEGPDGAVGELRTLINWRMGTQSAVYHCSTAVIIGLGLDGASG